MLGVCIAISGPVAQRIRHLTTNQGIPGSNPGRVNLFSNTHLNPFLHICIITHIHVHDYILVHAYS